MSSPDPHVALPAAKSIFLEKPGDPVIRVFLDDTEGGAT